MNSLVISRVFCVMGCYQGATGQQIGRRKPLVLRSGEMLRKHDRSSRSVRIRLLKPWILRRLTGGLW
jgi:hypothetical protein